MPIIANRGGDYRAWLAGEIRDAGSTCTVGSGNATQFRAASRFMHQTEAVLCQRIVRQIHTAARLKRKALVTTDTELSAMAAPANMGDSSSPNTGYSTPAAIGMPSAL